MRRSDARWPVVGTNRLRRKVSPVGVERCRGAVCDADELDVLCHSRSEAERQFAGSHGAHAFARGFDRFLVFGESGSVYESDEPVWDEGRVQRVR